MTHGYIVTMPGNRDTIRHAAPCVGCKYDLAGLSVAGACPECAALVSRSWPCCPRCRVRGRSVALERAESSARGPAWVCPECGGLGFDRHELAPAVSRRNVSSLSSTHDLGEIVLNEGPVGCGRCAGVCRAIDVRGRVIVDRCEACDFLWVDRDEFGALARFVLDHYERGSIPRDVQRVLHDRAAFIERAARATPGGNRWKYEWYEAIFDCLYFVDLLF